MQPTVLHLPRVAWDAALALIDAARGGDATFGWCRDRVAVVLGPAAASALEATRRRLADPTAAPNEAQVQLGLWRVRLDDAQRSNPNVGKDLHDLATELARRLPY
jgi:hypothetical protein